MISINGEPIDFEPGETILDVCASAGVDVPTLCFGDTLNPKNACRLCVVEVEGSRPLVPSCSRRAEDGMVVLTDTDRTHHSRKLVLELLGWSADLSATPRVDEWNERYEVDLARHGPRPESQPVIRDNPLYVRDYDKCILCYKCVDACGEQWQNTFAIGVSGRGESASISTEWAVTLPDSACVYCGNCVEVCPTGALMGTTEFDLRAANEWRPNEQTQTDTVCGYCGVGCNVTLHVQDQRIVKVTSPHDSPITHGNLCIKGRFGYGHV
jgi:predicted molibdopterin-dependent oxidoreductase YjgC